MLLQKLAPLALVPLATTATLLLSTLSLPAQQLTEGYSETTSSLPAGTSNVFTTSTGVIYFDGFDLTLAVTGSTPPASPKVTASSTIPIGNMLTISGTS